MKDFLGKEFQTGDTIVYAWRRGTKMGLRKATVTSVLPSRLNISVDGDNRILHNVANAVIISRYPFRGPSNAELCA